MVSQFLSIYITFKHKKSLSSIILLDLLSSITSFLNNKQRKLLINYGQISKQSVVKIMTGKTRTPGSSKDGEEAMALSMVHHFTPDSSVSTDQTLMFTKPLNLFIRSHQEKNSNNHL